MPSIYDNTITFNPTGQIQPLQYVENTVKRGSSLIAIKTKKFLAIFSHSKKLKETENFIFSFSGKTNDGNRFFNLLMEKIEKEKSQYGNFNLKNILENESVEISYKTRMNSRLFGADLIFADKNEKKIFLMKNTGEIFEKQAVAIGTHSSSYYMHFDRLMEIEEKEIFIAEIKKIIYAVEKSEGWGILIGERLTEKF